MEDEEESLQSPLPRKRCRTTMLMLNIAKMLLSMSHLLRTSSVMENMEAQQLTGLSMCISSTRVNWQLQRAVRTNDVDGYIHVLSSIIEVFFALNHPNYARWGSLFLLKLQQMKPKAREILEAGAMSIRRTKKSYARSAIDLCLEQTVNKYAASPMRGIAAFRNSESACRRWCITLTQRSMASSEFSKIVDLQSGEEPAKQKCRVWRDNADMNSVTFTLNQTCNPFSINAPVNLVNISSGKAANEETMKFLLGTLERGRKLRLQF